MPSLTFRDGSRGVGQCIRPARWLADVALLVRALCRLTSYREVDGSIPSVSSMNITYKKIRGDSLKALSKLDANMKPLHEFTYFKTWKDAWEVLRRRHGGAVHESTQYFVCEVADGEKRANAPTTVLSATTPAQ